MKVFVVMSGAYPSDQEVAGVYSTRQLAEERATAVNTAMRAERSFDRQGFNYVSIDEYELDDDN